MTTSTSFQLLIHDNGSDIKVEAAAYGRSAMMLTITDRSADVQLHISAVDTADLHNLLMRMLTAVASTAARARPDEPEPAENRPSSPCDTCGEEPVCVIEGERRLCAGCALVALEVGV